MTLILIVLLAVTDAQALANADAYIAAHRRGDVSIKVNGFAPGQQVGVSLKRLDFDFGAGIDIHNLQNEPNYRLWLDQNFNELVCQCYWNGTEPTQGQPKLAEVNYIHDYAAARGMTTRLHNMIWNGNQPGWVDTLRNQAVTSSSKKAQLLAAINSRIAYYLPTGYDEVDVYNESYNDGVLDGSANQYWKLFGAAGIAKIYDDAGKAAPAAKMFVNDYAILQGESAGFRQHVETLQSAGRAAGLGDVVDGVGLQYYTHDLAPHLASEVAAGLADTNALGLPTVLTEFGTFTDASQADSATILKTMLRMIFGNPTSTGFVLWDWAKNGNGSGQWAPGSAIINIGSQGWANPQITPAGKVWQDLLGIHDWDGNPANGWTTQLTATVGAEGRIAFNGYYGDYVLTVAGQSFPLSLAAETQSYAIGLAGDFNFDGAVDAADYTVWRDGQASPADYALWKAHFGETAVGKSMAAAVPEPETWRYVVLAIALLVIALIYRSERNG